MSASISAASDSKESVDHCMCGAAALTRREVVSRDEITGELFSYHECAGCGLERIVRRPTSADIGRYYPQTYYAYSGAHRRLGRHRL